VNVLSGDAVELLYLLAAVCFILALKGLSSPRSARRGNLIGAAGAVIALVATFLATELQNLGWILAAIAVGSLLAVPAARRVQMTQMPQLVALFNGVGGGAAAVVAVLELSVIGGVLPGTGRAARQSRTISQVKIASAIQMSANATRCTAVNGSS